MTDVKICGLTTPDTLRTAVTGGARYVGFVFYPPSPRAISPQNAGNLIRQLPSTVRSVGLFVDPDDETLESTIGLAGLEMIQLHGDETPARVREIKTRFHCPVIKALRIKNAQDLIPVRAYESVADWLLFDSRPEQSPLPGGTGHRFDWSLLHNTPFQKPWMLSGGLTPENVGEALAQLTPTAVDVSSGVEDAPGQKNCEKIRAFIQAVRNN